MRLLYRRRTLSDIVSTLRTHLTDTEVAAISLEPLESTMDVIIDHQVL